MAAAPFEQFVRENSPLLATVVVVILALLVVRLVMRTMTRLILLSLLVLVMVFVAVEHENITECTQTCECTLAGFDTSVPYCNAELPRTGT